MILKIPKIVTNIVKSSAAGNADHTPVSPNSFDNKKAKNVMAANPRMIDAAKANFADSTELNIDEPTIFIPANIKPVK